MSEAGDESVVVGVDLGVYGRDAVNVGVVVSAVVSFTQQYYSNSTLLYVLLKAKNATSKFSLFVLLSVSKIYIVVRM